MKLRNLILGLLTLAGFAVACQEEVEYLGIPKLYLSEKAMSFEIAGGSQDLTLTATRDWTVETDADWVVVSPEKGYASLKDSELTVTALENTGFDRETKIKFSIGMTSKTLTVTQAGPDGSSANLIVYANDYDKEVAEKTYGSGASWPYLDQFDGWMNATGTGAETVTYNYSGMSARNNSNSNGSYSDYAGSGNNNMFFGANAYLATKNITLGGSTDFELTFGTEKYSQDNGSVFQNSEFHIYLSQDGEKWVELKDYTFAGGTTEGRWNVASAVFSVPEGTESLSICMKTDVASSYRMDDLQLVRTNKEGVAMDFTDAVEMDFTAGGSSSGGSGEAPESKGKKTVEEFISLADTQNYYELTGTVSGFNATYCSFDLTDATGKIYVYSVLAASKAEWSSKIKNGGTVTIYGKYLFYSQKSQHEVVDAYIVSYTDGGSTGGGESDGDAIYANNFDKTVATKTYGSGSSWPYLDQFDGWQNEAGTGSANVTYKYKGTSARANSTSDGSYSDYSGSGNNNIFFGANAYFSINGIALGGKTDLSLSFGSEKYSQDNGSVFQNSEFHIWLSNDGGAKWVEFTDYTFAGTAGGRWNVATANFSVPSGTQTLSVCMSVDVASAYRMDDFKLEASASAGASVDFSGAVSKDFSTSGGGTTPPAGGGSEMTIAEVLAYGVTLPSGSTIEAVVISDRGLNNLTSKKGMYVQDETAGLQFYLGANHEFDFGDKVQIDLSGVSVGAYNGAVQISGLALDKITKVSSGNTVQPKTVSIADFLDNKYEGQYVAIEGVQVASSDLSKTFVEGGAHTSINIEDVNGNSFVVFSSKYATYGGETVPQGSGTIKGISSISNGNMQIIFAQASDYAGLTGERFEAGSGEGGEGGEGGNTGGGEVTGARYVKVTEAPADWTDGSYLIVYENGTTASIFTDGDVAGNFTTATISGDAIAADGLTEYAVTIEAMDGGYAVKAKGGYLYGVSAKNDLCFDTAQKLNTITMESDGVKFVSETSVLRFYSSGTSSRFRYYKSTTYSQQNPVQLYKYVAE